jgi:hypothetical protein
MAELKTKPTGESVAAFLKKIDDPQRREDCFAIVKLMEEATKAKAMMWGTSIVGFGTYHYRYASGQEGDFLIVGFAPRKAQITIYLTHAARDAGDLFAKLGKHKLSGSCLHIKRLSDLHMPTLKKLIQASVKATASSQRQASAAR